MLDDDRWTIATLEVWGRCMNHYCIEVYNREGDLVTVRHAFCQGVNKTSLRRYATGLKDCMIWVNGVRTLELVNGECVVWDDRYLSPTGWQCVKKKRRAVEARLEG